MNPSHRLLLFCLLVFVSPLATHHTVAEEVVAVDNIDELLLLFQNVLKDIPKEREIEQKYKSFARAEAILGQVGSRLSPGEAKRYRAELNKAFKRLPLPKTVRDADGLEFHLRKRNVTWRGKRRRGYYWSKPVTEAMAIAYLNTAKVPAESFRDLFPKLPNGGHSIFLSNGLYDSPRSQKPLHGVSYELAQRYLEYLAERRLPYGLPTAAMVRAEDKVSCWSSSRPDIRDFRRREMMDDFGVVFKQLHLAGTPVPELPEATAPNVELRLVTTSAVARKLYLEHLR